MVEKIGKDLVKVGVSQEDLEDSINGLSRLKPILQGKYRDTADEENLCALIRDGGTCPLDKLN